MCVCVCVCVCVCNNDLFVLLPIRLCCSQKEIKVSNNEN